MTKSQLTLHKLIGKHDWEIIDGEYKCSVCGKTKYDLTPDEKIRLSIAKFARSDHAETTYSDCTTTTGTGESLTIGKFEELLSTFKGEK